MFFYYYFNRFLDENIPADVLNSLCDMAVNCTETRNPIQLVKLSAEMVPLLVRQALPSEWFCESDQVTWTPALPSHPPKSWPSSIWKWLSEHPDISLDLFEGFPMVVHSCNYTPTLVKLRRSGKVIRRRGDDVVLPEAVASLLSRIGCIVIDDVLPYMRNHHQLQEFVAFPSAGGVLKVIQALGNDIAIERIGACSTEEKRGLRCFLLNQQVESQLQELLAHIPIFEAMDGQSLIPIKRDGVTATILPPYLVLPANFPVKRCSEIILGKDQDAQRVLQQLNVSSITIAKFLQREVFRWINHGYYHDADVVKLMNWVFINYRSFCTEDPSLRDMLKGIRFVKVCSDSLRFPHDVYDPRQPILRSLFEGEDAKFPQGCFASEESLLILKDLGMKQLDSLSASDIVFIAQNMHRFGGAVCGRKAAAILKYLDSNMKMLRVEVYSPNVTLVQHLYSLQWLTSLNAPPRSYPSSMPWFSGCKQFYSPNEIITADQANLVGAKMAVMDVPRLSSRLCEVFGWKSPPIGVVLEQLTTAITCGKTSDDKLKNMVIQIYQFLSSQRLDEDFLRKRLSSVPSIFIGEEFVAAHKVSLKWESKGAPYLYKLPDWAAKYKPLFQALGVKEKFEASDIIQALFNMEEHKRGRSLIGDEFLVAKTFIEQLSDASVEEIKYYDGRIPILDESRVLRSASELTINNTPWVRADQQNKFVHDKIPVKLAYRLGAEALLDKKLQRYSNPKWHPYGQVEDLTDRLKGILKSYPCDVGIFKELVQNADDASATEIHFVYDTRQLPTRHIFQGDSNWKDLQGPSLCVYNNRPFKLKDVEGFRSLGQSNKVGDSEKIGQYGIGFNVVYHLTDCPSYLSDGETLGILDPNARYAPGSSKQSPGALFNNIDHEFWNDCKDVMLGYQLCDELPLKGSTIFRLPLRTSKSAKYSKISNNLACEKIEELLADFMSEASNFLFFLNHVTKISVSYLEDDKLELKYSVSSEVSNESQKKRELLVREVRKSKEIETQEVKPVSVTYPMKIKDCLDRESDWLIQRQVGCDLSMQDFKIPQGNKLCFVPRAGIAAKISPEQKETLTSHVAFCFLPLPIPTGLPVHVNGQFALDSARRSLWHDQNEKDVLSTWNKFIKTRVLAQAYVTLLVKAKDYIQQKRTLGAFHFTGDKHVRSGIQWYTNLFPSCDDVHSSWKDLVQSVYELLVSCDKQVLPVVLKKSDVELHWMTKLASTFDQQTRSDQDAFAKIFQWEDLSKCQWYSPSDSYFCEDLRLSKEEVSWQEVLLKIGVPLVCSSLLKRKFSSSVKVNLMKPDVAISFLKSNSANLSQIGFFPCPVKASKIGSVENVKVLLEYCVKSPKFSKQAEGLPLLVTKDGMLREFSKTKPKYETEFSDLIMSKGDCFVDSELWDMLSKKHLATSLTNEGVFKSLDLKALASLLRLGLPSTWRLASSFTFFQDQGDVPNRWWLSRLWQLLGRLLANKEQDKNQTCDSTLEELKEWPIFPTTNGRIVSLHQAKFVLDLSVQDVWSPTQLKVAHALEKLKCPQIDLDIVCCKSKATASALVRNYVAQPNQPQHVLRVLEHEMSVRSIAGELDEEAIFLLLQFFQEDGRTLKEHHLNVQALKRLPFYKNVYGRYMSLENSKTICVLPNGVPLDEIELWMDDCTLLTQCHQLQLLYNTIGATAVSVQELYVSSIIDRMHCLNPLNRMKHMEFLKDVIIPGSSQSQRNCITEALQRATILTDGLGKPRPVCHFYDPRNQIYRELELKTRMLPEELRSREWYDFLTTLGLNVKVSPAQFQTYATRIAQDGATTGVTPTLAATAKMLVTYLLETPCLYQDESFLQHIADIPFVPIRQPSKELIDLQQEPYAMEELPLTMRSFRYSISSKHRLLAWTTCHILPSWAVPEGKNASLLMSHLGIHEEPPLDKVLDHLVNVSNNCGGSTEKQLPSFQRELLQDVTVKIFSFLSHKIPCTSKQWKDACTDSCKMVSKRLRNVPCIVVEDGRVFVDAKQIVFQLRQEIPPYLYTVPRVYGAVDHIFKQLGASENPHASHFAFVLEKIKSACKENEVEPNSLRKARSAVCGLFSVLWECANAADSSLSSISVERTSHSSRPALEKARNCLKVKKLYLLTDRNCLKSSTELVYNNIPSFRTTDNAFKYCTLLVPTACGTLGAGDGTLLNLLPEHLAVKTLHSLVREEVYPDPLTNLCSAEDDLGGCFFVKPYQSLLFSPQFREGVERVVKHERRGEELPPGFDKTVRAFQSRLQVKCVKSLNTQRVSIEGSPFAGTARKRCLHIRRSGGGELHLYISHSCSREELHRKLAKEINNCLNYVIRNVSYLQAILSSRCPEEIPSLLNNEDVTGGNHSSTHEVGAQIPGHLEYLLRQDSEFFFREGEIVGLLKSGLTLRCRRLEDEDVVCDKERNDEEESGDDSMDIDDEADDPIESGIPHKDIYDVKASVKDNVLGERFGMKGRTEEEEDGTDSYVFAKILHQVQSDINRYSAKYLVDIGETWEVSVLDLYKFVTEPSRKHTETRPDTSNVMAPGSKQTETVVTEVRQELKEIWRLPDSERQKAIRRLYLQWHPERNPENISQATAVTQLIEKESGSRVNESGGASDFSILSRAARQQRETFENFQKYCPTPSSSPRCSSSVVFGPADVTYLNTYLNPDANEARRWIRQAREDLRAAKHDMSADPPLHHIVCFQSQQVVEKALKAALYRTCGLADEQLRSHDVLSLATDVQCLAGAPADLYEQASILRNYYVPTRYPNRHVFPQVPALAYTLDEAQAALRVAVKLFEDLQRFIGIPI